MKTSVIRYRVADFLRESPPFDRMTLEDVLTFAGTGRVLFHEGDIDVFRKGDPREEIIWIIQQGRIEMLDEKTSNIELKDVLGPGDILGLKAQSADEMYRRTARTASEVILYAFDSTSFERLISSYPDARLFLSAHVSASTDHTRSLQSPTSKTRSLIDPDSDHWLNRKPRLIEWKQSFGQTRVSLDSLPSTTIAEEFQAVSSESTVGECFLSMLRTRNQSLQVTIDGSKRSPVQGILTDSDVELCSGRNPVTICKALFTAKTLNELNYVWQRAEAFLLENLTGPSLVDWFGNAMSELRHVLIERLIEISVAELSRAGKKLPQIPHAWMSSGEAGRREFLKAGCDVSIILSNCEATSTYDVDYDSKYYATLAQKVCAKLQACGLRSPAQTSTNAGFAPSRSFREWREFLRGLITDPIGNQVYGKRESLDFAFMCGDSSLLAGLREAFDGDLQTSESFIPVLANDTLAKLPPLTFFQGVALEASGQVTQVLDLEVTVLTPITDAARVLAFLSRATTRLNTIDRLSDLQSAYPQYRTILADAADAWKIAGYHQLKLRLAGGVHDVLTKPAQLTRLEQRMLKTAFDATRSFIKLACVLSNVSSQE